MNPFHLSRIILHGYKSIRTCDLEMRSLNVLIGANGAGKSNFVGFFRMIQELLDQRLQIHVGRNGGPDAMLHFGRKQTERIHAELYFGSNGYKFSLEPTLDNRLMFAEEKFWWATIGDWDINSGHFESRVETQKSTTRIYDFTVPVMRSWRLYHFHDTGDSALLKQKHDISVNDFLRTDARNLAAFLFFLRNHHEIHYRRIVKSIQLIAPFFGDFHLRPLPDNADQIELAWSETGSDIPFKAHLLSDGTLRFICLATVLLQPETFQPQTILIDEPELGLHPFAIHLLAAMLRSTASSRQVIVSTQSTDLLNEFQAEDVIVADRTPDGSRLRRLDPSALATWLEEYSLGELWQKNILGGRPSR
ncbi:MAG: AAA family ATPase [Magnetococcales bacterium]|nr:AAA family ATPase [Magnetococcales bacterium]